MNCLTLLVSLFIVGCSADYGYQYSNARQDGSYSFGYSTGLAGGRHDRKETRSPDGTVSGSFSYSDPTGDRRSVQYRAGEGGYVASGHVGPVGSPKSQLPLYDVGYQPGDSGPQAETSTETGEVQTEAPDASEPADANKEESGKVQQEDHGFFVLGLGGKRRLEKPSDTGMYYGTPSEPSRPKAPVRFYQVIALPYGYNLKHPILVPTYSHVPYVPYVPYVHAPHAPTRDFPTKSIFRPY